MSMTDIAKSMHRRAADLLCGDRIVFHHVPKCGGTSVGRTLRRAYMLSQGTVTPEASQNAFDAVQQGREAGASGNVAQLREMMLLYMLYSDTRCVSAHIPFSNVAFERFAGTYQFVTLLRDPVDRLISNYYWSHQHPGGVAHIPQPFDEFVLSKRARQVGATYVRYFCGEPVQEFTAKHVDAAIRNLRRMDCVGFLDEVGRFEAALRKLTGKRLKIGKENVRNTGAKRNAILAGAMREKALAACAMDREVWDAVQDLRTRLPAA